MALEAMASSGAKNPTPLHAACYTVVSSYATPLLGLRTNCTLATVMEKNLERTKQKEEGGTTTNEL
jgi:hypothetical protein